MSDYSLNETATLAKLAAKGAGYSWGMAEEVARAVFWLVCRDLPGPAMLLKLLSSYDTTESAKLAIPSIHDGQFNVDDRFNVDVWSNKNEKWICPVAAGCALSDKYTVVSDSTRIEFSDVKCPILLLPFVADVALRCNSILVLEMANSIVSTDGNQVSVSNMDSLSLMHASSITCRNARAEEFELPPAFLEKPGRRVVVEDSVWKSLDSFAQQTYAPSTEQSRTLGAGAGLNDND